MSIVWRLELLGDQPIHFTHREILQGIDGDPFPIRMKGQLDIPGLKGAVISVEGDFVVRIGMLEGADFLLGVDLDA